MSSALLPAARKTHAAGRLHKHPILDTACHYPFLSPFMSNLPSVHSPINYDDLGEYSGASSGHWLSEHSSLEDEVVPIIDQQLHTVHMARRAP